MIDQTSASLTKSDFAETAGQLSLFQYEWRIYEKLVQSNAMNHVEIAGILKQLIVDRLNGSLDFIDLACGDASLARTVLQDIDVRSYQGIDLSRPALDLAAQNLKNAPFKVSLSEEDMLSGIQNRPLSADMVWCGFSIHHLKSAAQKLEMLKAIWRALRPGGIFVCFEPTSHKGETRSGYLERNHQNLRQRFDVFTDEEFAHMWNHISNHDYPESAETWLEIGKEAGFSDCCEILRMPGELFCAAFLYEKGI